MPPTAAAALPPAKPAPRRDASGAALLQSLPLHESSRLQRLAEQLAGGQCERRAVLAVLKEDALELAFDDAGCRLMQEALQLADARECELLAAQFVGSVRRALVSPHANFVLQKFVEVMPVAQSGFIAEELRGIAADTARHRYGCRILCRLLEHSASNNASGTALINELLDDAANLCHHSFGRHVMECVLEHGTAQQQRRVAKALLDGVYNYARHRNASYILEKALALCMVEDQRALTFALVAEPERLIQLAAHECGVHVVRALLRCGGETSWEAGRILRAAIVELQASKYGRRALEELL